MNKTVVWLGAGIGGTIGGYIPMIWGASIFSPWSVILSGVGGLLGIYLIYKFYQ